MPTLTDTLRQRVAAEFAAGSQRELARKLKISQAQLCRFAAGKRGITLHTADLLCRAFGFTLSKGID
jgi:plasmid maintenance system antidote protein VapI